MTTENKKVLSLEHVLGMDKDKLTALAKGAFYAKKLGMDIPFTEIEPDENRQAKKDSTEMVPNGTGGMQPELDEDKLMVKLIVQAVDKDDRSNFSFANKDLLKHLGVVAADQAVKKLLSTGEIYSAAMKIQDLSGFGPDAQKKDSEAVKN